MSITTEATPTPEERGVNDGGTEGAATQTDQAVLTPVTGVPQDEVNRIVQGRLAEQAAKHDKAMKTAVDAAVAAALEANKVDTDALVTERVTARLAEQALTSTRSEIAQEYELDEEQVARLVGDTPEALQKDAAKIFGKTRVTPPVVRKNPGTSAAAPNLETMTPKQIREYAAQNGY